MFAILGLFYCFENVEYHLVAKEAVWYVQDVLTCKQRYDKTREETEIKFSNKRLLFCYHSGDG